MCFLLAIPNEAANFSVNVSGRKSSDQALKNCGPDSTCGKLPAKTSRLHTRKDPEFSINTTNSQSFTADAKVSSTYHLLLVPSPPCPLFSMAIPRSWDAALESLLDAPTYAKADVKWSNKIVNVIGDARTFGDAITRSVPCGDIQVAQKKIIDDPSKTRENHIRRMIMAPLTPRKPCVIPCPMQAVKQRDKQKIEKIMRQRSALSGLTALGRADFVKESDRIARAPNLEKRTCVSTAGKRRPTFYWGM
jgi:hypothetical protein